MKFEVQLSGPGGAIKRVVELERNASGWRVLLDGQALDADIVEVAPHTLSILLAGRSHEIRLFPAPDGTLQIHDGSRAFTAEVADPRAWRGRRHGGAEAQGRQQISAPMPGKVIRVLVKAGDTVEAGQGLVVVEAMKMQNELRAPRDGAVVRIGVTVGDTIDVGDLLVVIQ